MKPGGNHQPKRVLQYPFSMRKLLAGIMLAAMLLTLIPATLFASAEGEAPLPDLEALADELQEEHWYVDADGVQHELNSLEQITIPSDGTMPQFMLDFKFDISQTSVEAGAINFGRQYEITLPDGLAWMDGESIPFGVTEVASDELVAPPVINMLPVPTATPVPEATQVPTPEVPPTPATTASPAPAPEVPETPVPTATTAPTPEVPATPVPTVTATPTPEVTPPTAPIVPPTATPTPTPETPSPAPTGAPTNGGDASTAALHEINGFLFHIPPIRLPLGSAPERTTTQIGTVTFEGGRAYLTFDYTDAAFESDETTTQDVKVSNYIESIADGVSSCEIKIYAQLDESALGNVDEQPVEVVLFGKSIIFTKEPALPAAAPELAKDGVWESGKTASWKVTINANGSEVEGSVFTDTMTNQAYIANSFYVNDSPAEPVVTANTDGTVSLTYLFPEKLSSYAIDGIIDITYQSSISEKHFSEIMASTADKPMYTLINQAQLADGADGAQFETITAQKILEQNRPSYLVKDGKVISNNEIRWTITINTGGCTLNNTKLIDDIGPGLTLDESTLTVNWQPIDQTDYKDKYQYSTTDAGSQLTMDLGTLAPSNWKLVVEYVTKVTDSSILSGIKKGTNTASITYDCTGGGLGGGSWTGKVTVTKEMDIVKAALGKKGTLDLAHGAIDWVVTINEQKMPIGNWVLYEELDWGRGNPRTFLQRFDWGSFVLTVGQKTYSGVLNTDGNLAFEIEGKTITSVQDKKFGEGAFWLDLGSLVNEECVKLSYKTILSDEVQAQYKYSAACDIGVPNGVVLSHKVNGTYDAQAYSAVGIKTKVLAKDYRDDYNPATGEMTWRLTVNGGQTKLPMPDGKVIDTLPKGMTYVDNTAYYTVNGGNPQTSIAPVASVNEAGQQVLTFDLKNAADGNKVELFFKARLDINEVCWTEENGVKTLLNRTPALENSAVLERAGYSDTNKTLASATFPSQPVESVKKTGEAKLDDCKIDYSVIINPSHLNLVSENTGIAWNYIEDKMGYGLQLDPTTVKLERGTAGSKGFTVTDTVDSGDYTVEYTPEYQSSILRVGLPKNDDPTTCYRLSYSADVVLDAGKYSLTNAVSLNGMKSVISKADTVFEVTEGMASGLLKRMAVISLRKVDTETGAALRGAQFNVSTLGGLYLGSGTSDENGNVQIKVKPQADGYLIQEIAAPDGYKVSEAWKAGISIPGSGAGKYAWSAEGLALPEGDRVEGGTLLVHNQIQTGVVQLVKTDKQGKPLEGAVFGMLPVSVEFGTATGESLKQSTSGANGMVSFDNLKAGTYHIKELSAPANCTPVDDEILVTVDSNGAAGVLTWKSSGSALSRMSDGELQGLQIVENDIILGSVTIKKVAAGDTEQKGLAGAEFTLLDSQNQEVAKKMVNSDGVVTFNNLALGTYTLRETKAPEGYVAGADQTIVVNAENTVLSLVVENAKQEVAPTPTPTAEPTPTPEASPTPTVLPGEDDNNNDNDDDEQPAPTPAPAQPLPDGGVQGDIGDNDPDYFIDENQIPRGKGEIPDPVYWIDDNGIPLGYQNEDGDWVELDDGEIPLGAMTPNGWVTFAPQTGDTAPTWIVAFVLLSAAAAGMTGFAVYQGVKRTRKSREDGPEGRV